MAEYVLRNEASFLCPEFDHLTASIFRSQRGLDALQGGYQRRHVEPQGRTEYGLEWRQADRGQRELLLKAWDANHDVAPMTYTPLGDVDSNAVQVIFAGPPAIRRRALDSYQMSVRLIVVDPGLVPAAAGASEPATEPAAPDAPLPEDTAWDYGLTFIGDPSSPEYAHIKWNGASTSPVRMGGNASIVAGNTDDTKTASASTARPWAVACVFEVDSATGDHVIWTQGEGVGSTDDNISLEVDSSLTLSFKWGREGTGYNVYEFGTITSGTWYGVYVESDGTRLNATDATATNLADALRFKYVDLRTAVVSDAGGSWTTTGYSMGEAIAGSYYIGGLGTNDSLDGKVAANVVTTLSLDVTLPTDTEIATIIRDPLKWLDDYRVGNSFRRPNYPSDTAGFNLTGSGHSASATQVWLMGDGTNDAYKTIRNQVNVNDSTTTALNMVNMESSDIASVSITGLS